jgi:hypothetical protein
MFFLLRPNGIEMSRPVSPRLVSHEMADPGWLGRASCWAAQSLSYPAASPSWKWKMRIGLNKRKIGAAQ